MSIQHRTPVRNVQTTTEPTATRGAFLGDKILAALRIMMGLTFLWAFVDKTFGLGYATGSAQAWVNGGSPTKGFLSHVEVGPLQSMLRSWAGTDWADWLFMIALLGIGLALLSGLGVRLASISGATLLAFMWIAEWPPARQTSSGAATSSTNPLIDYHLIYIVVLIALAVYAAGNTWGFGRQWAKLDVVRRFRWLR
ncbi:MAG: thiosulfate dehydrogenase (quinone) large subunit [Actinomycetota bacterium]|jgi:thiosulfate dehydrogenase [quinone] large subunit|nr:thiosulfate dehydrogenase (quinone) large subunit [Actinomycetota bacterium]